VWTQTSLVSVAAICLSALTLQIDSRDQVDDPFKAAYKAIGGESVLKDIKTVRIVGTSRVKNEWFGKTPDARSEFIPGSYDTSIRFPDHFVEREDKSGAIRYSGFAGSTLLNRIVPGSSTYPSNYIDSMRLKLAMQVALPLFLRLDTAAPLKVASTDPSRAHVVTSGGTDITVEFDGATGLQKRITWSARQTDAQRTAGTAAVVTSIDIADFRDVTTTDGKTLLLPFRLTFSSNGKLHMEQHVQSIELNPVLPDDVFRR
jgi:hypothetical protein